MSLRRSQGSLSALQHTFSSYPAITITDRLTHQNPSDELGCLNRECSGSSLRHLSRRAVLESCHLHPGLLIDWLWLLGVASTYLRKCSHHEDKAVWCGGVSLNWLFEWLHWLKCVHGIRHSPPPKPPSKQD